MLYQKLLFGTEPYFVTAGTGAPFELHRHSEIEICFCLEGSYHIIVGGKTIEVKENELSIIGSLTPHEYIGRASADCKTIILEVGPALLRDYFEPLAASCKDFTIISSSSEDFSKKDELFGLLRDIYFTYRERPPMSEFIIKGDIYKICALLLQSFFEKDASPMSTTPLREVGKIEKALEIIYNRYSEPLDIEMISAACGYGKSNFCKIFKSVTGETFHNLLNRHRVEIACILLRETDDSIEQIAWNVGFSDTKNFCRVFKKHLGLTAGNYRKQVDI